MNAATTAFMQLLQRGGANGLETGMVLPATPVIASTADSAPVPAAPVPGSNEGGFARYLAEQTADHGGVNKSMKGRRYTQGRFRGKSPDEATEILRREYEAFGDDIKAGYEGQARGDTLKSSQAMGGSAASKLPFAGPKTTMTDMRGRPVSFGPSASAPARQAQMDAEHRGRIAAAGAAVRAVQDEQRANPAAVAARIQGARDAELAKDGITDMGGGTMAMQNQYGTGFVTHAEPGAPRKPGRIFDEKGEVDVGKMMGSKGTGTTVPYLKNGGDAIGADVRGQIQQGIAAAAPGAEARRAADAARMTAQLQAANTSAASAMPFPPPAASQAALPDDRPGVASQAARNNAMQKPQTVMDSVVQSLPPAFRVPPKPGPLRPTPQPNMRPKVLRP